MNSSKILRVMAAVAVCVLFCLSVSAHAQDDEKHGRKYKAPPDTAHITITILKATNGKPIANAAVIFHPVKDGKDEGTLEIKSDPEGKASIDIIAIGSTVRLQIIATGFATYGASYEIDAASKDLLIKMVAPRAQISAFEDNSGKVSDRAVGVQEPAHLPPGAPAPGQPAPSNH